jgi:hypothetical protein
MFQEGSAFAFGAICDASCPYGASLSGGACCGSFLQG